ncbi:MAG: Nudix hydrolase 3 [uncultured Gemmatimonadetes bacterium]|uniref:Nudix hydrolase 3 n=1 Tax=uncultured Gemmatimonadota bacterium TaxID=203437 RepID=A0A6J4MAS2_9BACT|nr:MAG: Nudix hydrolase 3 [uncultured Gemmatimonadota bacterium]
MTIPRPILAIVLLAACAPAAPAASPAPAAPTPAAAPATQDSMALRVGAYKPVRLTAELSGLSPAERQMIPLLIQASREMDELFWLQAYGSRDSLLQSLRDPHTRRFAEINYGPWDRLRGDAPFVPGAGAKPEGARFYPADMTKAEFEAAVAGGGARADSLRSLYTLVRRENGRLVAVPFHVAYAPNLRRAALLLRQAAGLAPQASLRRYLELRSQALLDDNYQSSDLAWLDMKDNNLDVVIGPIETYEDALFGYKAAFEAYVLVKDQAWSRRLARYAAFLPELQRGLPVPEQYRRETPGTDSELNAYDAVYYAGQANSGAKTIAINLPNDEEVQLRKGTRRLQLKNAMRAKFDAIMLPIARLLIAPDQVNNVTFDAFFENTMFHEVAHGLGIKNTVNGRGTVREALREQASGLEEEKADVLGLYMVTQLARRGEMSGAAIQNNYVTFLAGIFRSVRFGASSAHGRANMATFHFLEERGAFVRDPATGTYRVDMPRMQAAMDALATEILRMQGNGDHAAVRAFMERYGVVDPQLRRDLDRVNGAGIPLDVVFEQGIDVLDL